MEWISTKEGDINHRLPHNSSPVLCFYNNVMWVGIYVRDNEVECVDSSQEYMFLDEGWYELEEQTDSAFDEFYCKREVHYWMLLPNKPK